MSSASTPPPSRPSSGPTHDTELPDLVVDRSLGRIAVPTYFRTVWPRVHTLDDVYGPRPVEDVEWMADADEAGWVVACKDDRIRRRPAERALLATSTLRVFCLANGQLVSAEQVRRFERVLHRLKVEAVRPGPWMFGVYSGEIQPLKIYPAAEPPN